MRMVEMLGRHGLALHDMRQIVGSPRRICEAGIGAVGGGSVDGGRLRELGIHLTRAINDRVAGATHVLSLLGDPGNPEHTTLRQLFFMDRCANTIEQIPAMQHDPHRPGAVLKVDIDEDGMVGTTTTKCPAPG